jgi:hypothetical protein
MALPGIADITISTALITQPSQDDGGVVSCYAGDYDYNTALNAADSGHGRDCLCYLDRRTP